MPPKKTTPKRGSAKKQKEQQADDAKTQAGEVHASWETTVQVIQEHKVHSHSAGGAGSINVPLELLVAVAGPGAPKECMEILVRNLNMAHVAQLARVMRDTGMLQNANLSVRRRRQQHTHTHTVYI